MIEELKPVRCKCGGVPEVYTRFPVAKQKYQGYVECPDCGERVYGIQWHWDRDHAAEDAIEEWNKVMEPKEEYHCCCDCKYSAYGFRETYVCTNGNKIDRDPMYDAFDSCELWERKDE